MTALSTPSPRSRARISAQTAFSAAAAGGVLWNAYGIVQFLKTALSTQEAFVAMGMTAVQASLYASLPGWMTAAFAAGVFGGVMGCVMLLARRPQQAVPVLGVSMAGYVVLFAGDVALGVFAAFGIAQVLVVSLALAISIGLFAMARRQAAVQRTA